MNEIILLYMEIHLLKVILSLSKSIRWFAFIVLRFPLNNIKLKPNNFSKKFSLFFYKLYFYTKQFKDMEFFSLK